MPTNHDAAPALPSAGGANHILLRNLLVKRMAYCLAADESAQDLIAVDPQSGSTILAIIQNGRVFAWDPDDMTSAHDGTAVLVTDDGQRYKLDTLTVPYHVLDKDLTEPPESPGPEIGDAYLLTDPGTGDWADLGPIVTLTARGWEEIALPVGQMVYVADEDAYYHRKANGDIVAGLGVGSISDASLMPRHLLRGGDLLTWQVVNQTTQAPPGSPTEGDTYVVAAGGTGAWSGWDGSIARFENGAWVRYVPSTGWRAFDLNLNLPIVYQSTNWVVQESGYNQVTSAFASSAALTVAGSNAQGYSFGSTTGPTQTTSRRIVETLEIAIQAQRVGQVFDIEYQASVIASAFTGAGSGRFYLTSAAFLDSTSAAEDWTKTADLDGSNDITNLNLDFVGKVIRVSFQITVGDTSPHQVKIIHFPRFEGTNLQDGTVTLARRRITVRRRA